jgi:DNA-binding CsgD family transcriptional regulator
MRDLLQPINMVEAATAAPGEAVHAYGALRLFLLRLADAETPQAVYAELSRLGAMFRMPHLKVIESHIGGDAPALRPVYESPNLPEAVVQALLDHPMFDWAREARTPLFLSDLDAKLALRGMRRAETLLIIEGFLANLEIGPGSLRHYGIFGEGGVANGLSRALLHTAMLLAHERLSAPLSRRTELQHTSTPFTPTPREHEVLDLAMAGLTDAEIGKALKLATRTVRFHLRNMSRKAGVASRRALIAHAAQRFGEDPV